MAGDDQRGALFRARIANQHSRVTYAELFFDLVFAYAVTQISHTLLGRFTALGALQTTLLFLSVWWLWVYTAWITNWLDPEKTPVRLLLFALMLGGLVLSTSIPKAFESRGLWFALAYSAMQVGRTIFLLASTTSGQTLGAPECGPHPGVARGGGYLLDRGRPGGGPIAAGAVGGGAGHRISVAGVAVLDSEIRRIIGRGLGGRRRPYGRALRRLHHHRARRIHRGDRCDLWRSDLDHRECHRVCGGVARQHRDVVDLFPQGRRSRLRADFKIQRTRPAGAARPTPICTCRSWPASSSRRWPTTWC